MTTQSNGSEGKGRVPGTLPFWLSICLLGLGLRALSAPVFAAATWVNLSGNLAGMASECGNLTIVSLVPGSANVIAGVALKGLWINSGGTSWSPLGTGNGSATITNRPTWIEYDPLHTGTFWESGIYNGGGVYRTTDGGVTFSQLGSITHIDHVSVDFSDANRQTLVAGGHEQSQTVYRSVDGGQTWTNVGANIPANTNFSGYPIIVAPQTFVVNTQGWGSGSWGTYRTSNGGALWQQVSTTGPSGPPLVTSTGAIYWPANGGLLKSTDAGATWTQVGSGLQAVRPVEMPDGTIAAVGSTTLVVSSDGGASWSSIGATLPYAPASLIYSPARSAFFISHWDCGGVVLPDAIMSLAYSVLAASPPTAPTNLRIL